MIATPMICPACGELIIVWPQSDGCTLVIPAHPDLVTPFVSCAAGAQPVDSVLLKP